MATANLRPEAGHLLLAPGGREKAGFWADDSSCVVVIRKAGRSRGFRFWRRELSLAGGRSLYSRFRREGWTPISA